MGLRTADEFRQSLRDGRRLLYRGEPVGDVTAHTSLRRTIDHAAGLFEHPAEGPAELWAYRDDELGDTVSTYFRRPVNAGTLAARGDVIEETTRRARSTLNIVKVVGTDVLLSLEQVLSEDDSADAAERLARLHAYRAHCATGDLTMAAAVTDPKGDRTLAPSAQADADQFLRIVDEGVDGIVVRGAKVHTTASPSANELLVIPCRAMGPDDADYAIAFAIPVATEGLTLVCHPLVDGPPAEHPVSSRNIEVETLTIFDDVLVPWDRVFVCRQWRLAGAVAGAFANFHRFTAISYKPPVVDLMIGAAALAADQLGIVRNGIVREKIGKLITYGELIRCARIAAAQRGRVHAPSGLLVPDSIAANAGKYHFASGYHAAVAILQDLTGGIVVTAPGVEDLVHPEVGDLVRKYLQGRDGVDGLERWRVAELVRDLTASEFGGYNDSVTLHGEGSMGAQLVTTVRDYDVERCVAYARDMLDAPLPAALVG